MPVRRTQSLISSLFAVVIAFALSSTLALAFDRPFPSYAKRGVMKPDVFPAVVIDGKPRILTTGARIWNSENLTQTPASLPAAKFVVNYTEDDELRIDRIWILTPEEASQSPKEQNINQPRQQ